MAQRMHGTRYGRRASDRRLHAGWRGIFYRLGRALYEDTLITYASSAAFFAFLTLFPALAATLSLTGLIFSSARVEALLQGLRDLMPENVLALLREHITSIVSFSRPGLGFTLFLSLLFTGWSAAQGMKALMHGLNAAYGVHESRSALRLNSVALALGLGAVLFAMAALALIAALPPLFAAPGSGFRALQFLRWPLLAIGGFGALVVLYRYGPASHAPLWRFVALGAAIATAVWILASVGFSLYVSNVGAYKRDRDPAPLVLPRRVDRAGRRRAQRRARAPACGRSRARGRTLSSVARSYATILWMTRLGAASRCGT